MIFLLLACVTATSAVTCTNVKGDVVYRGECAAGQAVVHRAGGWTSFQCGLGGERIETDGYCIVTLAGSPK